MLHRITLRQFLKALAKAERNYRQAAVASQLTEHPGRVLPREAFDCSDGTLRKAIFELRHRGFHIQNFKGRGYAHVSDLSLLQKASLSRGIRFGTSALL